jgi:hypothetical protein
MTVLHMRRAGFLARKEAFEAWLTAVGAEVLSPTNEWELCRFRCGSGTSVVYTNKRHELKFTGQSGTAFQSFLGAKRWRAAPRTERRSKPNPTCKTLRERDGDACFYCHLPVAVEDESVEHLVSLTHNGPDHIANMALAHRDCNREAGHLALMEKIRFRETCWRRLHTPGTVANLALVEDETIDDLFDRSSWPPADETTPLPWEDM